MSRVDRAAAASVLAVLFVTGTLFDDVGGPMGLWLTTTWGIAGAAVPRWATRLLGLLAVLTLMWVSSSAIVLGLAAVGFVLGWGTYEIVLTERVHYAALWALLCLNGLTASTPTAYSPADNNADSMWACLVLALVGGALHQFPRLRGWHTSVLPALLFTANNLPTLAVHPGPPAAFLTVVLAGYALATTASLEANRRAHLTDRPTPSVTRDNAMLHA